MQPRQKTRAVRANTTTPKARNHAAREGAQPNATSRQATTEAPFLRRSPTEQIPTRRLTTERRRDRKVTPLNGTASDPGSKGRGNRTCQRRLTDPRSISKPETAAGEDLLTNDHLGLDLPKRQDKAHPSLKETPFRNAKKLFLKLNP